MSSGFAVVASVVIIITGAAAFIGWLVKLFRIRQAVSAKEVAEQEAERQRMSQRLKARILIPVGIRIPQNTVAHPWAGTSASEYGSAKRDELRRKGLAPADYARGITRRKTK